LRGRARRNSGCRGQIGIVHGPGFGAVVMTIAGAVRITFIIENAFRVRQI
jgi:hypothetical protein